MNGQIAISSQFADSNAPYVLQKSDASAFDNYQLSFYGNYLTASTLNLPNQFWTWSDGEIQLVNTGYCLDVKNSGTVTNTLVGHSICTGNENQQWALYPDNTIRAYQLNSSLCLTVMQYGSSGAANTISPPRLNTCVAGQINQRFNILQIPAASRIYPTWKAMGCYWDDPSDRALRSHTWTSSSMTVQKCWERCFSRGFKRAGVEFAKE